MINGGTELLVGGAAVDSLAEMFRHVAAAPFGSSSLVFWILLQWLARVGSVCFLFKLLHPAEIQQNTTFI